jgi:Fe-Mn family superoxide dismutase
MKQFTQKTFTIPTLKGISAKTIEEHLKLYSGYVTNLNTVHEIVENQSNPEYARRESYRRQAFEFDGMRNHEYYFSSFEGGSHTPSVDSLLYKKIVEHYGSFDTFLAIFKGLAMTRGVGWAMLGYDKTTDTLIQYWVDEQHLGQLIGVSPVLALDMWEHSFVADYQPSGKKQYVEDFFANVNWNVIEENFKKAQ